MIPSVLPTYNRAPLSFVKGEGSWLIEADGRRFLDLGAGIAVNALGHAHPALVKAITDQANALWHTSNLYRIPNQQALAETHGDQVAGNLDDLIIKLITENWQRPMSARRGMSVELLIQMLPDGTVTNASVSRSSGDAPFDNSAVAAVRNVGRIPEMQQLDRATFDSRYRQRRVIFKPED